MKIALDCHVSKAVREALKEYTVVQAQDGESDEDWFFRAFDAGATHVYSGDEDLRNLCGDGPVRFIRARPAQALRNQLKMIEKATGVKL